VVGYGSQLVSKTKGEVSITSLRAKVDWGMIQVSLLVALKKHWPTVSELKPTLVMPIIKGVVHSTIFSFPEVF
jgi:hypothetical protein